MHMSIIYGTTDNDEAKEMDQELKQGRPLNELIDIDEESLTSLIPEADYISDNIPIEDDDANNAIFINIYYIFFINFINSTY